MAHCEEYIGLISAAIDGALSPDQQEKLTAHLASCPECQKLFDDLSALHAVMDDLPPAVVPADLKGRIMDAVAAEAENAKVLPFAPKKASRHWQRWLASAAVLAVIVMGTWSWKPWENRADLPRSAETASVDRGLNIPDGGYATAGAADGASPAAAAPQPSAVPELASAPYIDTSVPTEKNAVRSAKTAPSHSPNGDVASQGFGASGAAPVENGASSPESSNSEMVYGYCPDPQAAGTTVPEDTSSIQPASSGESSSLQAPAEAPAPQGAVMPRLFSAPIPSDAGASNGSGDTQPTAAPRLFSITPTAQSIPSPAGEEVPEQGQAVTSQAEAVYVLANYIYEFVDTVEPVDDASDVYTISSPTGVSGTVTCLGEFEPAFLLDYQESLSTEVFHYSVSRSTGEVFLLGQEKLSDPV